MQKNFYSEYFEVEDKHWWFVGRRQILLQLLELYFSDRAGHDRQILDVGCGTGTMLGYLQQYGQARGVDADENAVAFCNKRGLTNVERFDGVTLPFGPNECDLVTMFDVLEHIENDAGALAEVFRVLKPGGLFMLTVPAYDFLWGAQDEISHHKRRYVAPELEAKLTSSGFRVDKLSYFNSVLFAGIAAIRLLRRLVPGRPKSVELKSDFTLTKQGGLNSILSKVFSLERFIVARANIPFGVSIVAVAVRPS